MPTIRSTYGVASRVSGNHFIAGLECEIEDLTSIHEDIADGSIWEITSDGSLRNSGKEFISRPLDKQSLLSAFDNLHNSLQYKSSDCGVRFSQRTSTHIHVNCLDLEEEQVKAIVLWYALFEPIFFLMASPIRRNNIHCVGLDQTVLSESYKRPLAYQKQRWSKYTALNILPLSKYGTIEFRHLEGTDDLDKITQWLNTLENLWMYGQKNPITKEAVLSDGAIREVFCAIFKDSSDAMKYKDMLPQLLADSIIDIKLSLI